MKGVVDNSMLVESGSKNTTKNKRGTNSGFWFDSDQPASIYDAQPLRRHGTSAITFAESATGQSLAVIGVGLMWLGKYRVWSGFAGVETEVFGCDSRRG